VPVLLDLDDVDWLTLEAQLAAEPWPGLGGRIGMQAATSAVRRATGEALPKFAGGFVACGEDAGAVATAGLQADVLPNIPVDGDALTAGRVETPAPLPPLPDEVPRKVLFVGDLRHGPNQDGLARFLREGWPVVRAGKANVKLQIIGRGLDEIDASTRADWSGTPGVEVTGFVDDLRTAYAGAAMTIAPTWWGGGTKIKVVESAAMGRFCLATGQACRGYGALTEGASPPVQVVSTAEAMGRTILRKFEKTDELRSAALAGPKQVQQYFSFSAVRDVLRSALTRVLSEDRLPAV
ncbi:MAG: glycosyltransferase family 4 protein, partial [Planctomycetota bacterium]